MRGQESGSEHERETDGSAAPATPPPSFGRPTVQAPSAFQEGAYGASHGDALAAPSYADLPAGQVIDSDTVPARPPIPVYQGPPPDLPAPEPAQAPDAGQPMTPAVNSPWAPEPAAPSSGPWSSELTAPSDGPWSPEPAAPAGAQGPWSPSAAPESGTPWSPEPPASADAGSPWTPEPPASPDAGTPWAPELSGGHPSGGQDAGQPVEGATIERPRPDRPLPAFPGVPAETWSAAAQPWEQTEDGRPYDWFADPEPGAETTSPQPGSVPASPQPGSVPASPPPPQGTWAPPGAPQPPAPPSPGAPHLPAPHPPAPGAPDPSAPGAAHAPVPGAPMPGAPVPGAPVPGAPVPGAPVPGVSPPPAFGGEPAAQHGAAWTPPSPWAPDQPQTSWTPAPGQAPPPPWSPGQSPQTGWQPPQGPQPEGQPSQGQQTEWQPSPGPQAEWPPSPGPQAEWPQSPGTQAEWPPSPGTQAEWPPSPGPQAEPWKPSPAAWQAEPDQAGWQPPQAFTAAAAGMKVWPSSTTDAPAMPPWPAATGEPIDDHDGPQEAQATDPSMTVPISHSAEPGDVPVWPPHPPGADHADERIPDLPFDSATWGRAKGDQPPADVLDDPPADRAATPEAPALGASPAAGAPSTDNSAAGAPGPNATAAGVSGPNVTAAGVSSPNVTAAGAPGTDLALTGASGHGSPASDARGAQASPNDTQPDGLPGDGAPGNDAAGNRAPGDGAPGTDGSRTDVSGDDAPIGGTTGSDAPHDHPFPTDGAIPLPAIPPPAGLPALPAPSGGAPAVPAGASPADLPTPPHGTPAATFDPFSPVSQGGIAPPPEPPAKEPSTGRKALIAGVGVLVVLGVATGGFFAYRSMSTGQPAEASASTATGAVPSVSDTDDPLANSLLNSEGTDPEKMSINEAFPEQKVDLGGRVYTRVKVDMSDDCRQAAAGPFATALQDQKCSRVLRATYVDDKKRYAISTGIAVLPNKEAAAAADQAKDLDKNLWFRPLTGPTSSGADRIHIAGGYAAGLLWGRYIVFSYATFADGHTPTAKEKGLGDVSGAFRDHTSLVLERRITE